MHWKNDFSWHMIDIFFPPFCCHCGKLGYEVCPECFDQITTIDQSRFCHYCGQKKHKNKICDSEGIFFNRIHSWGSYSGPLKSIIRKLKYNRGLGLVNYFLSDIVDFIHVWFKEIDTIIPLPLGKMREHQRGYNQTAVFAKPVAEILRIEYLPDLVERTRETISQVGLTVVERKENILDAFHADRSKVSGKRFLIMDDITTTGSTINECSKALKLAGAANVSCFTLAKANINNLELEAEWIKG